MTAVPAATAQLVAATQAVPAFTDRVREWAATLQPAPVAATISRLADAADQLVAPASPTTPTTGEGVEATR